MWYDVRIAHPKSHLRTSQMKRLVAWLTGKDNREAVLALLTVATTVLGGGWFLYDGFAAPPPVAAVYTIAEHEAALARREAEIRADLGGKQAEETEALLRELAEVHVQKADLDASFADRKAELDGAKAALEAFSADLPARHLEAAFAALAQGDTSLADAIFAEVAALEADGIDRAATADFQRGKLAEADIRWSEAAARYADAARLAPTFEHLAKAREFAGLTGDYPAALRLGDELIAAAIAEDGDGSGSMPRR